MSAKFALRKDSYTSKVQWRAQILVKVRFRGLRDSNLSGLCTFELRSRSKSEG